MLRQHWLFLIFLGFAVLGVWGFLIALLPPLLAAPRTAAETPVLVEAPRLAPTLVVETPTPAPTLKPTRVLTPTLTAAPTITPSPAPTATLPSQPLPALYVDGAYLKRSDTQAPIWLKGVNIEEFRQSGPHTFVDLYYVQGLRSIVSQKWGINLLRVAVDPETVESNWREIDKLIGFAQDNGMYVILVPFGSAVNPARSEQRMTVPDNVVGPAMGYLAGKFKNRTNVLYGLWNEPHPDSIPSIDYETQWELWMQAGIRVAQDIRSKNPKAILVVPGGTKWARDLTYYKDHPFPFDNVVYDIHDYAAAPDFGYSRDMWTWAIGKYPLLIGEMGGNPINPVDPLSINYMQDTLQIANENPNLVHYAMYVLTSDGAWGIFTRGLSRMPKGDLFLDDLGRYPPTRLR